MSHKTHYKMEVSLAMTSILFEGWLLCQPGVLCSTAICLEQPDYSLRWWLSATAPEAGEQKSPPWSASWNHCLVRQLSSMGPLVRFLGLRWFKKSHTPEPSDQCCFAHLRSRVFPAARFGSSHPVFASI